MQPPVDFYASQAHYADHMAPLWWALEPDQRGSWWCPPRVAAHLRNLGVTPRPGRPPARWPRLVAVAGFADVQLCRGHPLALVEHGAGQAYEHPDPSYSGGPSRDAVVLFLCPNEVVAARNAARYPDSTVEVIGSPRVDELAARFPGPGTRDPGTVALSFHWPCNLTPECGWAFHHYERTLPALVAELGALGYRVVGHGHPRARVFFHRLWTRLGIDYLATFDEVAAAAGLYVCDNSSTLYEFAALGRPVVVLNSPAYRRDVMLWPRFWHCADVGVQVNEPDELLGAIELATTDPPWIAARRAEVLNEVYPLRDGRAARRGAHALVAAAAAVQ